MSVQVAEVSPVMAPVRAALRPKQVTRWLFSCHFLLQVQSLCSICIERRPCQLCCWKQPFCSVSEDICVTANVPRLSGWALWSFWACLHVWAGRFWAFQTGNRWIKSVSPWWDRGSHETKKFKVQSVTIKAKFVLLPVSNHRDRIRLNFVSLLSICLRGHELSNARWAENTGGDELRLRPRQETGLRDSFLPHRSRPD